MAALGRHVASEGVSKGCPHCRDAPWGVSEAATSPVLSQTPRGRTVALGIVLSAPETPHGASLQWGPRRNRHLRDTLLDWAYASERALTLLRSKLGPLEADVEDRIRSTDADLLLEWGDRIPTAESLQDVFRD